MRTIAATGRLVLSGAGPSYFNNLPQASGSARQFDAAPAPSRAFSLAVQAGPNISRAPAAPWGLPNRKAAFCRLGRKAHWWSLELHQFPDAKAVVSALSPDEPVILNRPHAAARAARFFVEKFPGKSLYAVKANPSPELLRVLWDSGVTHYDVASIAEVRLVRATLPGATLCFMHPVKTASAI